MNYKKLQEELSVLKRYAEFSKNMTKDKMQHLMWDGMGLSIVNLKRKLQYDMLAEKRFFNRKGGKVLVPGNTRIRKKLKIEKNINHL